MAVLYRKYRPQTLKEVVGQQPIVRTLKNQVLADSPAHAYLFVGSRGVGKTSVARILAKAINCLKEGSSKEAKTGDACGICEVCKAVEKGNFIDLVEIDAASNTGVDNVRELIEHVRFAPSLGKYKVFIVDEVHMLSKGAFNALLKTLEEPPAHAIFVLATTEAAKVPATIISRTQRFDFKKLALQEVEAQLEKIISSEGKNLPSEAVKLIALNSEGGMRDALSLLDKVFTLGNSPAMEEIRMLLGITDTAVLEKFLELIVGGKAGEIPIFLDSILEAGTDFVVLNRDFLEYLRKILVIKISGVQTVSLLEDRKAKAQEIAAGLGEADILFICRLFLRSLKEQMSSPSPDLPMLLAGVEAAIHKQAARGSGKVNEKLPEKINLSTQKNEAQSPSVLIVEPKTEPAAEEDLGSISEEEVKSKWPAAINRLMDINGPLAHLLKSSPIIGIQSGKIKVEVKYKFHKQNLEHPKNQQALRSIFKEIYGQNLVLTGEVKSAGESEAQAMGVPVLNEALKVFGGELVE